MCVFVFVFPFNTFSFVRVLIFPAKLDFHLASGVKRIFFNYFCLQLVVKIDKSFIYACLKSKLGLLKFYPFKYKQ